ncbi:MAG TPA: OsmC family protein [Longimicrobiales bacterium]|nr:OsmC family protein [Longimicrobiales bacterium]
MADVAVTMKWTGEGLRFRGGRKAGPEMEVDGDNATGPSPVVAMVLGIGGCMAADVVDIGTKMRLPITGVEVQLEADRRPDPPRRLTAVRMKFLVDGVDVTDEAKVRRAVDMSRDTYCSVLHSLRDDIAIDIDVELR